MYCVEYSWEDSLIRYIYVKLAIFEYSGSRAFVPRQNLGGGPRVVLAALPFTLWLLFCFARISFVVAMLDDIPSPTPSRSVPICLCTFCTQLFCYLNEDILMSEILFLYNITYQLYW